MAVKVGDRVRYTEAFLRRMDEGHLFHPGMGKLLGTVAKVQDTPTLTIKQFANVEWDEPLLCLPQFTSAEVWVDSAHLVVVK